jgi:hypothetical protein
VSHRQDLPRKVDDICRPYSQEPFIGQLCEAFFESSARITLDQDGDVLDILVQTRRDKKAAKKFFRELLKTMRYVTRALITDKLKSYSAAKAAVLPDVEQQKK